MRIQGKGHGMFMCVRASVLESVCKVFTVTIRLLVSFPLLIASMYIATRRTIPQKYTKVHELENRTWSTFCHTGTYLYYTLKFLFAFFASVLSMTVISNKSVLLKTFEVLLSCLQSAINRPETFNVFKTYLHFSQVTLC